jgi:hypothetical protein
MHIAPDDVWGLEHQHITDIAVLLSFIDTYLSLFFGHRRAAVATLQQLR